MFFVRIKVGLFEATLRCTSEWSNTTQDNKFYPHIKNTPRILFTENEGSLSLTEPNRIFSDIKL